MLALMDGTAPMSCIYFIFIIVIGALFLLNYTYAILCLTVQELHIENRARADRGPGAVDRVLLQLGVDDISLSVPAPQPADPQAQESPTQPSNQVPGTRRPTPPGPGPAGGQCGDQSRRGTAARPDILGRDGQ